MRPDDEDDLWVDYVLIPCWLMVPVIACIVVGAILTFCEIF